MILVDLDAADDQIQIVALQRWFFQNIPEYIHSGFRRPVHPEDGVAFVAKHPDLMADALDFLLQLRFHLIVGFFQKLLLLRVLHHVPDSLPLGGFQFRLQVIQNFRQTVSGVLCFRHILLLPGKVIIQPLQHSRRIFHHLLDVQLQHLIQNIHPDVVGSASVPAPAVVSAAGVGSFHIFAAHGEHGAAAVAALQKSRVHIVVLFHTPVMGRGALFPQGPGGGEGAVVDDGLVVVFDDDVLVLVPLHILAVDLPPGVFGLPEGANVEIIV